jgi:trk system potassium uptake protein TrkH
VTQWIGGLGVVILFVALLGFIGVGTKALFSRESSAVAQSDVMPRVQSLTLRYLYIYLGFTLIGILGLIILQVSFFESVCHALCAISTGGFSPHNESVGYYHSNFVTLWLAFLMFVGGIALPVHYVVLIQRRWGVLKSNEETRVYGYLVVIAALIIAVDLAIVQHTPVEDLPTLVVDSFFQLISITTTTGFVTVDFNQWPTLTKFILVMFMIIGGCAGSTAGGMKIARFIVFLKTARRHLQLIIRPNKVARLRMNGRILDEEFINAVVFYFAIYFVLLIVGILGLSILQQDIDLETTFSAAIASFNNIGPGLGKVGAMENYAFFNVASKMWLCLFMLLGRLEIYAILLLFLPSFWKKF